jgi:type 1 glutamine amidotransferase
MPDHDPGPSERLAHLTVPRLSLVDARRLAVRWARRHDRIYAELAREARRAEAAEARVQQLEEAIRAHRRVLRGSSMATRDRRLWAALGEEATDD